jgi:hypothetical protein
MTGNMSTPYTNDLFPDFDQLRQWRAAHYANWDPATAPRRRRAVITIVRNEPEFFPIWLSYYSRFFAADDIYVLDHDTTDGSTSLPGFVRIPVSHPTFDITWLLEQITTLQHRLLADYDVVVVCDVDEIIAPDPASATPDLGTYLDRMNEPFVNCIGYQVLHQPDVEPPIDFGRPLLAQRGWWYRDPLYNKPLIATTPMQWIGGFHRRADNVNRFDPDLRLIHLHHLDVERCFWRHVSRANFTHATQDLESGLGWHNRISDRAGFDRWFFDKRNLDGTPVTLEAIDPRWHTVI